MSIYFACGEFNDCWLHAISCLVLKNIFFRRYQLISIYFHLLNNRCIHDFVAQLNIQYTESQWSIFSFFFVALLSQQSLNPMFGSSAQIEMLVIMGYSKCFDKTSKLTIDPVFQNDIFGLIKAMSRKIDKCHNVFSISISLTTSCLNQQEKNIFLSEISKFV